MLLTCCHPDRKNPPFSLAHFLIFPALPFLSCSNAFSSSSASSFSTMGNFFRAFFISAWKPALIDARYGGLLGGGSASTVNGCPDPSRESVISPFTIIRDIGLLSQLPPKSWLRRFRGGATGITPNWLPSTGSCDSIICDGGADGRYGEDDMTGNMARKQLRNSHLN